MSNRLKNSDFWSRFLKHALAWAIFITYEILYLYLVDAPISKVQNYILNYTLNIILFYLNAHVLFRFAIEKLKGSIVLIILLFIIEILFFTMIKYPINLLLLDVPPITTLAVYKLHFAINVMRSFFIVGFSTAYAFALLTIKRNKQISRLETQKLLQQNEKILLQKDLLKSRNAYLQAQVNPHLLFNTLNFMYNASSKVSEKLAEAVMTLSDIMRYALTSIDEDDKVPLDQEIDHITNYIQLNQIRYNEKLHVNFQITGHTSGLRIIPLALITLVENVFKYGDLLDPEQPARIDLTVNNGNLELELFNKKRANRRIHGHGTGIANLKERLAIYYPGAYIFDIKDGENTFALKLNLTLT